MKQCITCQEQLDVNLFGKNKATKDGLNKKCKECYKAYQREWYKNNKEIHSARTARCGKEQAIRIRKFMYDYKSKNPCVDCGETNPVVLDFDHKEQSNKSFGLSKACAKKISMDKLKLEISKCDVRCANCHRIKTAKQLGWYKNI